MFSTVATEAAIPMASFKLFGLTLPLAEESSRRAERWDSTQAANFPAQPLSTNTNVKTVHNFHALQTWRFTISALLLLNIFILSYLRILLDDHVRLLTPPLSPYLCKTYNTF